MHDLKPLPDRSKLASAIALHAGAGRDLRIAEQASELAARRHWEAQSKLDELRKVVAAPTCARAADFIASVAAGTPCGAAMLERAAIDAHAQVAAAGNEAVVWEQTSEECDQAVRTKEAEVATAQDRVARAAREVICNSETVKRLSDCLEALQAEVIETRSTLRFIWRNGVNGELPGPLKERVERLLWRDLMGMESTPASAAWSAAFNELLTNSDAEIPS